MSGDDGVASVARSLAAASLLCELTAALPSVLEQNLSEETIRTFKHSARVVFEAIASHLVSFSPALPASGYAALVRDAAHAIMGLYPATHPAPAATRALADPELSLFRIDFADELTRFLSALAADHVQRLSARPAPTAEGAPRRSSPIRRRGKPRSRDGRGR